jgi:hypothetical protein
MTRRDCYFPSCHGHHAEGKVILSSIILLHNAMEQMLLIECSNKERESPCMGEHGKAKIKEASKQTVY